jgi:hypothetical protein
MRRLTEWILSNGTSDANNEFLGSAPYSMSDSHAHFMLQKRSRFQSVPDTEPARVAQNFEAP